MSKRLKMPQTARRVQTCLGARAINSYEVSESSVPFGTRFKLVGCSSFERLTVNIGS